MSEREPLRHVRSRVFDSARWRGYDARRNDIIIATYSKCGTTWMQRIVSMLVFRSAEPKPIWNLSPWPDMRLFGPVEEMWAHAEAQTHRRFFKSHLPFDALPVREGVKFIHVARDGRDAAMSFHNHLSNFLTDTLESLDAICLQDPKFGDPYPRTPDDPAAFFHDWVADDMHNGQGDPAASFFHVENSYWAARDEPNMLLIHYADLKKDRASEMRRVADFLEINIAESLWPSLIEAASFDSMKRDGNELVPEVRMFWGEDGANRFFNRGTNGRWQNVLSESDLRLYQNRTSEEFAPDLSHWLENGRFGAS